MAPRTSCLWGLYVDIPIMHSGQTIPLQVLYLPPVHWRYNAINQWYWLQYHDILNIMSPHSASETNLIRPLDLSASYAAHHKLVPFRKWLNISHLDTYIHGPFEFALIQGQKPHDCIAQEDWDHLKSILQCLETPFCHSMFRHTWYTLIAVHTTLSLWKLTATLLSSRLYCKHQNLPRIGYTRDKRSRFPPNKSLSFYNMSVPIWDPTTISGHWAVDHFTVLGKMWCFFHSVRHFPRPVSHRLVFSISSWLAVTRQFFLGCLREWGPHDCSDSWPKETFCDICEREGQKSECCQ